MSRAPVSVHDHERAHSNSIISSLMPETTSECAVYLGREPGEPCSSAETIAAVGSSLGISGATPAEVIDAAKAKLSCDTEKCVVTKLGAHLGEQRVRGELMNNFKIRGPIDNQLLSNVNIDSILQQWTNGFADFYAYNFNMLNYASHSFRDGQVLHRPDTLATVKFADLYPKYKCAACVINSDKYQGPGKHWMALFADARGKDRWTIEFFNSSGNNPAPEWINWMQKTKLAMEAVIEGANTVAGQGAAPPRVEIIRAVTRRMQKSKSECGVYSLFYIWSRLNGVPPEYFATNSIPDSIMFEFRHHLFASPVGKTFDWEEYQKRVKLSWER